MYTLLTALRTLRLFCQPLSLLCRAWRAARRKPWWTFALVFHLLLFVLAGLVCMVRMRTVAQDRVIVSHLCSDPPRWDSLALERDVFKNPVPIASELPPLENPVVLHEETAVTYADGEDVAVGARAGGGAGEIYPLHAEAIGASVGIGGGGGGQFGHRGVGGRRRLTMTGGGSCRTQRPSSRIKVLSATAHPGADAALRWLAVNQDPDGHWDCARFGGKRNDTAVTALAVLAYLGAGHTEKVGAHRETLKKAVGWLVAQQEADGRLGAQDEGRAYVHAIAGLALAEAAGMAKRDETVRAAGRALAWSCTPRDGSSAPAGAWRYEGGGADGDLSVSGWYILQLKAARTAGLPVPQQSLANAWDFLDRCASHADPRASIYAYQYRPGSRTNPRLNAIGHACRSVLGAPREALAPGVRRMVFSNPLPGAAETDLHYWYFGTLAAFHQGGDVWKTWHGALARTLKERQHHGGILGGSWQPEGPYSKDWGRVGQTALSAMMLEIYYRYLPLYEGQRPTAAGKPRAPARPGEAPADLAGLDDAAKEPPGAELYEHLPMKDFVRVSHDDAFSTFAVDVDTASYANVRRILNANTRVPKGAVRIEEMLNYFDYDYTAPEEEAFALHAELAACPWNPEHRLALVALKGREIPWESRPPCNLVFLVDVSGSMSDPNKLPLVQKSLAMLVQKLGAQDRVAVVVYAGREGLALPSTPCDRKAEILAALERLSSGGSTNGGAGIALAYRIAQEHFVKAGVNRVILCTDGDFNVGIVDSEKLIDLVQARAKQGTFLTVLGFGMGNYKDATLEKLADQGNGNYGYIDTELEARKMLVTQAGSTMVTIAKDVKVQVEFNPARAAAFRLLGYENRLMAKQDFRDDAKDAGEIGAGHTVTALYEIVPAGDSKAEALPGEAGQPKRPESSNELFTVYLRHKEPDGERATERQASVADEEREWTEASDNFRLAAAAALFGMELKDAPLRGEACLELARKLAQSALGQDAYGYRAEFIDLIGKAANQHGLPPEPEENF